MRTLRLMLVFAVALSAQAPDSRTVFELLKTGASLSAANAAEFEKELQNNPSKAELLIQLLAYYASQPKGLPLEDVKAARLRHVLAVLETDPRDGLGLFRVATGVYRINCQGDDLADPKGAEQVANKWLEIVATEPNNQTFRREAVEALQYCTPEKAETLLRERADNAGLGQLYARAVLGITAFSYSRNEPAGSSAELRKRPFALRAHKLLETAAEKDLLVSAAGTLLREGALLWADRKLDWDYTPLGKSLLARAQQAAPDAMALKTVTTELPRPGERPPMIVRVGGKVQQSKLKRQIRPKYPLVARDLGIQGVVSLEVLLGLDGRVLHLRPVSGPSELIPSAVEAVKQWEYQPTLLNGRPCYIATRIDVQFTLSR